MQVWDNDGTGAIDFHAEDVGQARLGSIVENRIVLDRVLSCIEGDKNITVLRGAGVKDIEQNESEATIVLDDGQTLNASLIVAADGGSTHRMAKLFIDGPFGGFTITRGR